MIITAKADGTLIKTVPDRVYQGSNNADTIIVVAPIIQSATMNIRFKLPQINEYTQNFLMTPANDSIYSDLGVSVWTYSINSALTQYYGTVQAQFAATVNGAVVSSGAFTFEVERGVEVDLPDPADPNYTYDDIYDYLTDMSTRIFVNGDLEAKAILPYDETFTYRLGATIFNSGDFYTSLVNNNLGNALTDTTKWQKTDFYSAGEVDGLIDTLAGRKYPLGSTTGTGEIFNDYTNNVASGNYSHAGGYNSSATNANSFVHGYKLNTSADNQAVFGILNADDADALFIVGGGSVEELTDLTGNAFTVKRDGAYVGGIGGNDKKLATQEYVGTVAATKQDKIDSSHKLSADLVDDANTTNKFVTVSEKSQITTNANDIAGIEDLIPNQASAENQLADKNFVNSSISTNTANFIGTFASVTALNSYAGTITNNDYAFVINQELDFATTTAMNNYDKTLLTNYDYAWVENGAKYDLYRFDIVEQTWGVRATSISKGDVSLIVAYNRYKYNSTTSEWNWEYTLNTSGFTANQWAAINSGITDTDVAQISTNTTNIANKTDKYTYSNFGYSPDSFNYYSTILTGEVKNEAGKVTIKSDAPLSQAGFTDYKSEILVDAGNIDFIVSSPNSNGGKVRINNNEVETQNNKVTSLSSSSTDTEYPTAKCVYDLIGDVETLLASI